MRRSHVSSSVTRRGLRPACDFLHFTGFLSTILICQLAHSEPTAADKSLATQLFKEGRALVDQGKVSEGCRKLEESQRLDPGGGTLLNVALCHEKEGRTATAWAEFTEALGIAKKDDRPQRIELAQTHIAALEPTLSRLVIQVPEGSDLPELEIKRDGSAVRRAAWGSAMPVDPGEHLIEASAHGKIAWKHSVNVAAKADTKTVVVPALENAPTPPPSAVSTTAPVSVQADTRSASRSPAGWVAMGFGAVGVGVGTFFGLRALSQQKTADKDCDGDVCHNPTALAANSEAIKSANLATVGFGVGIVGIGVGTFLLLSGGSSSSRTATNSPSIVGSVGPSSGGVAVSGRW
jgi:hypothetical protein